MINAGAFDALAAVLAAARLSALRLAALFFFIVPLIFTRSLYRLSAILHESFLFITRRQRALAVWVLHKRGSRCSVLPFRRICSFFFFSSLYLV